MGRSRSSGLWLIFPILALLTIAGCGGGSKAGPPLFAGKVTLNPSTATSLELGGTLAFTAAVQTTSGTNLTTTISYDSSDTSILTYLPLASLAPDIGMPSSQPVRPETSVR